MVLPQTEATSSAKEQKCDRPRYVTQIYSSTFFIPLQSTVYKGLHRVGI